MNQPRFLLATALLAFGAYGWGRALLLVLDHFGAPATLDIAGAVSPAPGIPLTRGGPAVVAYLANLGYSGIVATVSSAPGLYSYKAWSSNMSSGIEDYRAMAAEYVAWPHDLSQLSRDHDVHRYRYKTLEYLSWFPPRGRT